MEGDQAENIQDTLKSEAAGGGSGNDKVDVDAVL